MNDESQQGTVSDLYHLEKLREADQRALDAALAAVKEENAKTERQAEKRFDLLNELRQGVATISQLAALEKVVDELKERLDRNEGQTKGSDISKADVNRTVGTWVGVIGLIITVVVLIANGVL